MRLLTAALLFSIAALTGCSDQDAHAADDTGINTRDAEGALPTPDDQGGSEAERAITQAIRKAVVADDTLSVSAENVKIITQGGVVTLRGPVKTTAEKVKIESLARAVAGVTRVDNLLEVAGD
jgi:hyperosmotically inducible periplasmic protein